MDLKLGFMSLRIAAKCFFAHEVEISLVAFHAPKNSLLCFMRCKRLLISVETFTLALFALRFGSTSQAQADVSKCRLRWLL